MLQTSLWITGSTRSGKTTRLANQFRHWVEGGFSRQESSHRPGLRLTRRDRQNVPAILIFAANDDNRRDLGERLTTAIQGRYPVRAKTPLGFFQDEVMLFWPLVIARLDLKAQFPLRLRPETEQELATELWASELDNELYQLPGGNEPTRVRRLLDLLQLAAVSGTPTEDIPQLLAAGMPEAEGTLEVWARMGQLLLDWRYWCLDRGLLTYGIICELYGQHLLSDPTYQQHLRSRYQAVLADDVDDYPAIARHLFERLLTAGAVGAFAYNPDGKVRLGLNADPDYLEGLAARCQVEPLPEPANDSLAASLASVAVELVTEPLGFAGLPAFVQSMQTTSRAALLRQTGEVIVEAVHSGRVQPREIAIVAPGLDAIARYTLTEILTSRNIPIEPLNEQRPLISSPMVRALLTLLALVYPGLGRLVDREAIAEMLVVLSQQHEGLTDERENAPFPTPAIDPVRAGLLADYCYSPDPDQPRLQPVESFPRWDRLGRRATAAYAEVVRWLEGQQAQQQQGSTPSCVVVLDRAIQKFLWNGSNLPYDQLAALRELMETAQHYWEVDGRLRQEFQVGRLQVEGSQDNLQPSNLQRSTPPQHSTQAIARFIQLLRRGTVTANPYPVRRLPTTANNAVTLATIFQYRASRRFHRWHFWLDAGSHLWEIGGAATLWGAPLFLNGWSGRPWTQEDQLKANQQLLQRILRDLSGRVGERVYLCHSDLSVTGNEQAGPLLTLVHASMPLAGSPLA